MADVVFGGNFTFADDADGVTIQQAYEHGLAGARKDPEADRLFDERAPSFASAAGRILGSGQGKVALLYKYVLKFDEDAYIDAQKTGDCVSHGTRNAIDATRAIEILIKGEAEGFYTKSATEGIYGSRGHSGQGMSCSGAANWVTTEGGLLLRQNYPEIGIDLSDYKTSYKLGMGWGRSGVPREVTAEAAKHRVRTASRIRTIEEARDALANGYGIAACSGLGFESTRDSEGIARRRGSWAHCMAWLGVDAAPSTVDKYGGPLFLVQNSWGYRWISGPKRHDQPDGSFWITPKDAMSILRANGAYAFSNVDGFPPQKIPDWGFTTFATAA